MKTVNLPLAGEKVELAFNLAAMETLHGEYGDGYIAEILRRLNLRDPKCLRMCVEHMASKKVELAAIVKEMPVDELALKIADAINLALTGKPTGE